MAYDCYFYFHYYYYSYYYYYCFGTSFSGLHNVYTQKFHVNFCDIYIQLQ